MDKTLGPQSAIWLIPLEAEPEAVLPRALPAPWRDQIRLLSLSQALRLLLAKVRPALVLLEGPPNRAAQHALSRLLEAAPELTVLVLRHWENAEAMRAWVSQCMLEAVRPAPVESLAPLNAYRLSHRELEVLRLIVKGMIKKEIAEGLAISYHTVDNHERSIFKKLNVHNRSAAVAKALLEQIV